MAGHILWVIFPDLESLELMFHLVTRCDLAWDQGEDAMQERGFSLLETVHQWYLCTMSKRDIFNGNININIAQDDLFDHLDGCYIPSNYELLYQWLEDGKVYPGGRHLQANIFELNLDSRQKQLPLEVVWKLLHILFAFDQPVHTISLLWFFFYALIMGKPIIKEFFASSKCIWNNVARLHYIDKAVHSNKFGGAIKDRTKYGFQRYFLLSSDDLKHFKRNFHILIMTDSEGFDTEEWTTANFVYPNCRLVTSAVKKW